MLIGLRDDDEGWRRGACHCGGVVFRVRPSGGVGSARRCTCSLCRMRGTVAVSARKGNLELLAGEELLRTYRFGSGVAAHHFCGRCGIYTHHGRRSNPDEYGVNLACLEGCSPFDLAEVPIMDGIRHPADGHSRGRIGSLRVEWSDAAEQAPSTIDVTDGD